MWVISQRRESVFILSSQGLDETNIAMQLNVNQSTVSRDIKALRKQSQKKLESIVENELPYECAKSLVSMDHIINECWNIYRDENGKWTNKNKLDALKMIRETQRTRFDIMQAGPLNLRLQQMEKELRCSEEVSEEPKKSYMNLKLPALNGPDNEDRR